MPTAYQAAIDWSSFAHDVQAIIDTRYGSYAACVAAHEGLNRGLLSRACNAKTLSAANYLHLCQCLQINPFKYYDLTRKVPSNQCVTVCVPRETIDTPRLRIMADVLQKHAGGT